MHEKEHFDPRLGFGLYVLLVRSEFSNKLALFYLVINPCIRHRALGCSLGSQPADILPFSPCVTLLPQEEE